MLRSHKLTNNVAVIGGGIAGCLTAYHLANFGLSVDLFEAGNLTSGASANPLCALHTSPDYMLNPYYDSVFITACHKFAQRFYRNLQHGWTEKNFLHCVDYSQDKETQLRYLYTNKKNMHPVHADVVKRYIGSSHAGWLQMKSGMCRFSDMAIHLTKHKNINLHLHTFIQSIAHNGSNWQLHTSGNDYIYNSVVLANASAAENILLKISKRKFLGCRHIRGQSTLVKPIALACNIGGERTLLQSSGISIVNATDSFAKSTDIIAQHTKQNIATMRLILPKYADCIQPIGKDDFVGVRCTTDDRLPIIGPCPNDSYYINHYAPHTHKEMLSIPQAQREGLYINIGYGFKAASYAPLCSYLVARQIAKPQQPLTHATKAWCTMLHPGRFLLKKLHRLHH